MSTSRAFARARARERGELLTRTARWRCRRATLDGALVSEAVLVERVGFLQFLITETAQAGLEAFWSEAGIVQLLGSKRSFGYRALEQAHGRLPMPEGVYLDSRAVWLAEECCARTLRSADHQRRIVSSYLESGEPPAGTDRVSARNARRQIVKQVKAAREQGIKDDRAIPEDFFDLRPTAPRLRRPVLPLACTDRQFASVDIREVTDDYGNRVPVEARLRLKLPLCARPVRRSDWGWHELFFPIPSHTRERLLAGAELRLPSLRLGDDGRLLSDWPVEFDAPAPRFAGAGQPKRVLSLDWGERRLLTGSVLEANPDGTVREIAGPFRFDAREAQAKMECQRTQAKHLKTLIDRNLILYKDEIPEEITERIKMLEREAELIWEARAALQQQLAHQASRWAVKLAEQYECRLIAAENLRTLEPKLRGARLRDRLNHQIRGHLLKHMSDKASEAGIQFTDQINPKGTSSECPRCSEPQRHVKAPDNLKRGRGWALCPACGSSLDRDHSASLRIGAKALSDISSDTAPNVKRREPHPARPRASAPKAISTKRTPNLSHSKKPRVARSRHRRDPERSRARSRLRARELDLHRSTRRRPRGAGSRAAVTPATQPVRHTHGTHCETGTGHLPGFKLARATKNRTNAPVDPSQHVTVSCEDFARRRERPTFEP